MADQPGPRARIPDDDFDFNAGDLSKQFEQLLRLNRLRELEEQSRPRSSSPAIRHQSPHTRPAHPYRSPPPVPQSASQRQPPAYQSYRSHPIVPSPPQDASSLKFRNMLLTLSTTPINYENPGLLDEALTHVPVDRIHREATEEHEIMKGIAASISDKTKPEWGYQDCVIKSLLRWFKRDFFTFVTNPTCTRCYGATVAAGPAPPTPDEAACGASRTELYRCTQCSSFERFPRYSDVWTLLKTRKGRAGEFANCFGMLCRAAGARARWIWNSEDHVWNEVYSEHQKRWIHVDACEEMWDNPRVYTEGWSRKMAYCVAFSVDGATDVTRRYVRKPMEHGLPRSKCSEEVLLWIMYEIRKLRRENMEKEARRRLLDDDEREERELRTYVGRSITTDLLESVPGGQPNRPGEIKSPAELQQEAAMRQAQQHHYGDYQSGQGR